MLQKALTLDSASRNSPETSVQPCLEQLLTLKAAEGFSERREGERERTVDVHCHRSSTAAPPLTVCPALYTSSLLLRIEKSSGSSSPPRARGADEP